MAIRTTHTLLTDSWTADVQTVETALGRFPIDAATNNDCQVAFFEMARDGHLHVNVTHQHPTKNVPGWSGPATLPRGFVHNRTFNDEQSSGEILRHVRAMVLAASI